MSFLPPTVSSTGASPAPNPVPVPIPIGISDAIAAAAAYATNSQTAKTGAEAAQSAAAVSAAAAAASAASVGSPEWSAVQHKPTSLSGYGITDAVNVTSLGAASGVATLDGAGKIPSAQLPSYVDDVLEYANLAALPATGEAGKIYVALDTNYEYRWSGSTYIRLVASPGSTDAVAEGTTNLYFTSARALAAVPASSATPLINGTASAGSAGAWSRGDHVHPTDTSRLAVSAATAIATSGSASDLITGTVPVARLPLGTTGAAGALQVGTNLSVTTGVISLASGGVTGALGFTPLSSSTTVTVAQGGTGVTTSTGSGNVVLSTSPTLTTPNLGTPSALVLTSATGLPWSAGITGKPTTLAGYGISDGITAALAASTYAALTGGNFSGQVTATGTESNQFALSLGGQEWRINMASGGNFYILDQTHSIFPLGISPTTGVVAFSTTPTIGGTALSSLYPLLSSGPAFAGDIYSSGTNAGGVRNIQVQNASTTIGTQARLTLSTGTPNAYALWYVNQDSTSVASLNLGVGAGISGVNITPMVNFGTSPIAPTPANTDVSTKVATTAFVSSVLADYSNNAKYAGVLPNGSDMTALNAAYFSAAIAKGMPLFYPPGTYQFNSPVAFDMTASLKKGIKIQGAGIGQTIFQSNVTATGGNPLFYFYSGADWYDLSVSDICFSGAINDVLGAVGKNDFSDPLNVANFTNVAWLNSYPGSNNVALRMNYVVNSHFNNCRANSYATGQRTLTSSTSNSVGTGAKSFTIAAGQSVAAPGIVSLKSVGSPSNTMTGTITSYNSTTGALVLNITSVTGSGTFSDWSIYFAGLNYGTALQLRQAEFCVFNGGSYGNAARAIQVKDGFSFTIVFNAADIENMDYGVSVSTTSGGLLTFVSGQFSLWEQAGVSVTGSLSPNAVTIINPNLSNPNNAQPFIDQANYAGIRLIDGTSISTPSLPTTGSTWTNKSGKKVLVTWWGGTVTSAVVSGQTIAVPSGSAVVPHGQGFILNFTGSPNWFHQALE